MSRDTAKKKTERGQRAHGKKRKKHGNKKSRRSYKAGETLVVGTF